MRIWSRREWLWKSSMGVAALSLTPGLLAQEPHVTVSPLNNLSDDDEIELGRRFAAQLEKEEPTVSNSLIDRYLGSMVDELAKASQRPNLPYSVKLVNSDVANACSLPGGSLYVNRGLVELIESEDELAATLSHEIGHVVGRHVVNQLMLDFTARSLLEPVLDNLHKRNGVIEKIILELGGAVAMMAMLHFSREDEAEADLLGFYEMLRAGWDPHGFLDLFAHLDDIEKSSSGIEIPFLSDHPSTPARAAAIRRELTRVTLPSGAITDTVQFQVFKAALRLLPEPPKESHEGDGQTHD